MKFLILGSTGMAGHLITAYLRERGHEVCGLSRRKFFPHVNRRDCAILFRLVVKGGELR